MTRSTISKRRRRRLRGKKIAYLRHAWNVGVSSGPAEPWDASEIKAAARKRYSFAQVLKGAEAIKQLNDDVAWMRDGEPVGREII